MVTKKEALALSRWNGSVKIRINGEYVLSSEVKPGGVFGEKRKDRNSPSYSQRSTVDVFDKNGTESDGSLVLTRHEDIGVFSCCLFICGNAPKSRMIYAASVEMSNAEGIF